MVNRDIRGFNSRNVTCFFFQTIKVYSIMKRKIEDIYLQYFKHGAAKNLYSIYIPPTFFKLPKKKI
jgi:hypothetical protein